MMTRRTAIFLILGALTRGSGAALAYAGEAMRRSRLAFTILVAISPLTAAAQQITWLPHTGLYAGLSRQVDARRVLWCASTSCGGATIRSRVLPSPFIGLTVVTQTDGIGFEASITSVYARIRCSSLTDGESSWRRGWGFWGSCSGPAFAGVGALRVAVTRPVSSRASLAIGAGVAVTSLGQQVSEETAFTGPTFSARFHLPTTGRRSLQVGVTSMVYTLGRGPQRRVQHDLMLYAGWGLESER